ncbi:hypothetical protein [Photobacterium swingsii]
MKTQGAMMGCCNQAPKGGTRQLGFLLKVTGAILFVVLLIAMVFG